MFEIKKSIKLSAAEQKWKDIREHLLSLYSLSVSPCAYCNEYKKIDNGVVYCDKCPLKENNICKNRGDSEFKYFLDSINNATTKATQILNAISNDIKKQVDNETDTAKNINKDVENSFVRCVYCDSAFPLDDNLTFSIFASTYDTTRIFKKVTFQCPACGLSSSSCIFNTL